MKPFWRTTIGLAGGIIGILIGLLLMLIGAISANLELDAETFFLGYLSSGTFGLLAISFSVLIIIGALLTGKKAKFSVLLQLFGGLVGFILLGVSFVLPMLLALVSAISTYFASGRMDMSK